MEDRIRVAIKLRPLLQREAEAQLDARWSVRNYFVTQVAGCIDSAFFNSKLNKPKEVKKFHFDHTFNEQSKNLEVFDKVIKPIVDDSVYGCNGTIIAYGEQSSGKTHAMFGTAEDEGIISLSVGYMLDMVESERHRRLAYKVSCFEIYKERLHDLLDVERKNLRCMRSMNDTVQVVDCKEVELADRETLEGVLAACERNRRVCESGWSKRSNRSHVVVRIGITNLDLDKDCHMRNRFSQLDFVDLAGQRSESRTSNHEKSDLHVNLSLSFLNLAVIRHLCTSDPQRNPINPSINSNYSSSSSSSSSNNNSSSRRRCKLTELLANSIAGNAQTAFVCAIAPTSARETLDTLWFASRVARVVNKPKFNSLVGYVSTVTEEISRFYFFVETKIARLLSNFQEIQESDALAIERKEDGQGCECASELPLMTRIFNSYKSKLSADFAVPSIKIEDVVQAFCQLNDDFQEFHSRVVLLKTDVLDKSSENVIGKLFSVERALDALKEKIELLETLTNAFTGGLK